MRPFRHNIDTDHTTTITKSHSLMVFLLFFLFLTITPVLVMAESSCSLSGSTVSLNLNISFTPTSDLSIPEQGVAQIPVIVGVIHSSQFHLFRLSERLNDSVAEVAAKGTIFNLEKQLNEFIDEGNHKVVSDFEIIHSRNTSIPVDGTISMKLKTRSSTTKLSLMVHLSPSPVWFAGLDSFDLCSQSNSSILQNLNAGLDKGSSFMSDPDPYPQGETVPVSLVDILEDVSLVSITIAISKASNRWWIGLAAALGAIVLFAIIAWFTIPKLIQRKRAEKVPLTTSDNVEW